MTYQWKDKVVLITGAATGIGEVVVRKLLETEGVKHIVIFDISDAGFALEKELNSKYGNRVTFVKGDVTKDDQLSAAFKAVTDRHGSLDVLINNAALMNDSYEVYKKMVDVNVHDDYYSRTGVRMMTVCFGVTDTSLLSTTKMANFDKGINNKIETMMKGFYYQKPESAANGLLETYKQGENGSTWVVMNDKPPKNITPDVTKAYQILTDSFKQI